MTEYQVTLPSGEVIHTDENNIVQDLEPTYRHQPESMWALCELEDILAAGGLGWDHANYLGILLEAK